MSKNPTKKIWCLVAIGILVLFLIILANSVITIGERISRINQIFGYVFYGFIGILIYALILHPILIIVFSPTFSLSTTIDKDSKRHYGVYKKVAKRLLKRNEISKSEKERIRFAFSDSRELKEVLNHTFNHFIKNEINKKIMSSAKAVMISTAISQNDRLDSLSVIVLNIRMIKAIVAISGFRPSFRNLAKLTINVFLTALIAEGLENLDISDFLPTSPATVIGNIPLLKPLLSSMTQGIANALLTLRIGFVTRKYLFADLKETTKEEIRRGAFIEAIKALPKIVSNTLNSIPKKISSIFKKKESDSEFKSETN